MNALARVTLAVLAGGRGQRMGRAKGLLQIDGRPILEFLLERLSWPGPTLLVTAPGRQRPPGWERFDREVVDAVADEGPLRGVMTALEALATDVLFITTVDMPGIGREQAQGLVGKLAGHRGVMCRRGEMIEPFPMALRIDVLEEVRRMMAGGERSVRNMARAVCDVIEPSWDDDVWVNLNRPEDLARYSAGQ